MSEVYRIGDNDFNYCPLACGFGRGIKIEPVHTDMTHEEIEKEIRKNLERTIKAGTLLIP